MAEVVIRDGKLVVNNSPVFLRSGSVHYWRLAKDRWEHHLDKMKSGSFNSVCTYIPWFWHEYEEGKFDFDGSTAPQRDLIGFLNMVSERGLYMILRPGPFINSELRFGGHPEWLFRNHPELQSKRVDGNPAFWIGDGVPVPSQLNPEFLRLVGKWYDKVFEAVFERTQAKGNNVILFQPDNEMNLVFTFGLDSSLYEEAENGEGLWFQYLKKNYGTIEKLNQAYGTSYTSFTQAEAPRKRAEEGQAGDHRRVFDWLRFKQWYVSEYAARLSEKARSLGLKVPLVFNEPYNFSWMWNSGEHAEFRRLLHERGIDNCLTTAHTYLYGGEMDEKGIAATVSRVEITKTGNGSGPHFSMEAGAGWCEYGPRVRAKYNWDMLYRVLIGHGLNGVNFYTFSGGKNPENSCKYGEEYRLIAVLGQDEDTNSVYSSIKRINEFVEAWNDELVETQKSSKVSVLLERDLALGGRPVRYPYGYDERTSPIKLLPTVPLTGIDKDYHKAYSSITDLAEMLCALDIAYEYVHTSWMPGDISPDRVLVVPNSGRISEEGSHTVLEHLKRGGAVYFYPQVPAGDHNFGIDSSLLDVLGIAVQRTISEAGWKAGDSVYRPVNSRHLTGVPVYGPITVYEPKESHKDRWEALAWHEGQICAFKTKVHGGTVVVDGILPRRLTISGERLFLEILESCGKQLRTCRTTSSDVLSVLRFSPSKGHGLVTVFNATGGREQVKLSAITPSGEIEFPVKSELTLNPKESYCLWTNLKLDYAVIEYCTSELVPLNPGKTVFKASGASGSSGEISLDRPFSLRIDDRVVDSTKVGDRWVAVYSHGTGEIVFEVVTQ